MATGVNKVILVGNLGKDPEIQNIGENIKKASFSVATTEAYKNRDGEKVQHTEWHNVVLWRGLADIAETYLRKGNQVYIEGRLRTRSWDDKDGVKRYTTEILVDNMTMLGGRRDGNDNGQEHLKKAAGSEISDTDNENDDLPF